MKDKFLIVIPARLGSSRLPGKPLLEIDGIPMVCRVYMQALKAGLDKVVVATDSQEVLDVCRQHDVYCVMTDSNHLSGTDRVAEVAAMFTEYNYIINVQGDEPLIDPELVRKVAQAVSEDGVDMASARTAISLDKAKDENVVKVVTDNMDNALYFSRSLIPFPRRSNACFWQHIGIYAYSRDALLKMSSMPPHPLELAESLEQLRALAGGMVIRIVETSEAAIGVDTAEDLEYVRSIVRESADRAI